MKKKSFSRRNFIATLSAGSAAVAASGYMPAFGNISGVNSNAG